MPFLLIGGHAINAYGISRQTGDIDLLVQHTRKHRWLELLAKLRYSVGQDDDRFSRFRPDTIAAWPIDLMYVDDETFNKLLSESQSVDLGLANVRVPSARHLATLKIHALKHFQAHRNAKDYNDLIQLLRSKQADISTGDLKALCERYANFNLFDKIIADLKE